MPKRNDSNLDKFTIFIHPDDTVEEALVAMKEHKDKFSDYDIYHMPRDEYNTTKMMLGAYREDPITDKEFWEKGTAYIVPHGGNLFPKNGNVK